LKVLVTDPEDDLAIERDVLGADTVIAGRAADPASVAVAIVHQTAVDAAFLGGYPNLAAVVRLGVGYDKVDLAACRARGVRVANVPDYCTSEVADTAMAMILDLVRGVRELEAALHAEPGRWQQCSLLRVRRAGALTLGVIGAGRIGTAVLQRATPFGFARIFHDPVVLSSAGAERVGDLATLLARADVVSVHVPLDADTRGMIDADFIACMRTGAMLVNTARGGLLGDEQGLLDALVSRKLGRCGV
jgi:phosphoglycerate dehydrogenase-like enzyme